MSAIEKAKQAVGGPRALARMLTEAGTKITPQAVGRWKRVPADRAIDVSKLTGVSVFELRPDIYPSPDAFVAGDAA